MSATRILGPLLALLLLLGIGYGIFVSAGRKAREAGERLAASAVVEVRGMIGSEKEGFFSDPRVIDALAKHGLKVQTEKTGSREISQRDTAGYDFGFPAGSPAAIALKKKANASQTFTPFFTPMAIASWRALLPALEAEGLVRQDAGTLYVVDMKKLMDMINRGVRWRDLKNNAAYATGKSVLVNSTDIRKSNSAAMYLSLASYLANDNNVVGDPADADRILPPLPALFLRQGLQESSSAGPFEDYTTMGMGKAPLVMIYESQFLEYQSRRAKPNPDMVVLYPQPTLFTKHTLVPFTEGGRKLGEVLSTDPELQKLAAEYGYRTSDPTHFRDFLKSKGLEAPETIVDVIDPPSFEILERMISQIEAKYH